MTSRLRAASARIGPREFSVRRLSGGEWANVRDAGANNDATRRDLENAIIGAGFVPVIRDTYWKVRNDMELATA